jgi:hypothetical protein
MKYKILDGSCLPRCPYRNDDVHIGSSVCIGKCEHHISHTDENVVCAREERQPQKLKNGNV